MKKETLEEAAERLSIGIREENYFLGTFWLQYNKKNWIRTICSIE